MADDSQRLTQQEHQELGQELRLNEARLRELYGLAIAVYGLNHHVSFGFQKVLEAMGRLRADLRSQLHYDLPDYNGDSPYS